MSNTLQAMIAAALRPQTEAEIRHDTYASLGIDPEEAERVRTELRLNRTTPTTRGETMAFSKVIGPGEQLVAEVEFTLGDGSMVELKVPITNMGSADAHLGPGMVTGAVVTVVQSPIEVEVKWRNE